MADAKYLKVSDVGTAVETAISAYTGNANEIINTNGSGKVDSTLIDFPVSNENFKQGTHSGLDFEILEGKFTVNNNILIEVAQDTLTLTDDALNYIGVTPAGTFAVNTTGFADFVYPLYTATTLSGAITLITDLRRRTNLIDIIDDTATTETDVTYSANQINTIIHTQNTDYKLDDYDQTIDITGLISINFLTGAKAITAGKNKVILTSDNETETFTITNFPSYLVELRPESGLLINILPSSTFQTQLGMIVSLNGDINDFIIIKKNS